MLLNFKKLKSFSDHSKQREKYSKIHDLYELDFFVLDGALFSMEGENKIQFCFQCKMQPLRSAASDRISIP